MGLRDWLRRRALDREARVLLAAAFRSPAVLQGTSLAPRHRGRWVLIDHESEPGGGIARIRFGIVRHPRPYPFSPQSHKVLEVWRYHVREGRLERLEGHNLTRARGDDAD